MAPILIAAALSLLGLLALVARLLLDRGVVRRRVADRDVVTAHWESLVMQRRDLRLAVDALGVPTLHGRAGAIPYTIQISAPGSLAQRTRSGAIPSAASAARRARSTERRLPRPTSTTTIGACSLTP